MADWFSLYDANWNLLELGLAGYISGRTAERLLAAPPEIEPHIPTAMEDWDADFERATGISPLRQFDQFR